MTTGAVGMVPKLIVEVVGRPEKVTMLGDTPRIVACDIAIVSLSFTVKVVVLRLSPPVVIRSAPDITPNIRG